MKKIIFFHFAIWFSLSLQSQPIARFSADTTEGCVPLKVEFMNLCNTSANFEWKFGDGKQSSLFSPTHLYTQSGTYEVTLIASNAQGEDTLVKTSYIRVHAKPTVNYSISSNSQCLNKDSVNFINLGDTTNSYTWVFGDGNSTQAFQATHQYQSAGAYHSLLQAKSPYGCTAKKSLGGVINVFANPVPYFTVDQPLVCEANKLINFTSTSSSSLSHYWDFGDGNVDSSSSKVSHIYANQGIYDVSLRLKDQNGCTSQLKEQGLIRYRQPKKPKITLSSDTICSRENFRFRPDSNWVKASWDFGDGKLSDSLRPVHRYLTAGKYAPKLTLTDSIGCKKSLTLDSILVNQKPIASISDLPQKACLPYSFKPENTSFFAQNYRWELDSLYSNKKNPTFEIQQAGIYSLKLLVENSFCRDSLEIPKMLEIQGGIGEAKVSDTSGCAPLTVEFSLAKSNFKSIQWEFGNGDTAKGFKVNYTYEIGGSYQPMLFTETTFGCLDTIQLSPIFVSDAKAVFQQPDTIVLCQAGSINFDGSSIGGNQWVWDFGDGDSSAKPNPIHFFDSAGTYSVKLRTENTHGCYYRIEPYNVVIVKEQQANFKMIRKNCPDHQLKFIPLDSNILSRRWDFGDGSSDTVTSPTHFYDREGFYTVSLSTIDADGCSYRRTVVNGVEILKCVNGDSIAGGGFGGSAGNVAAFSDSSNKIKACAPFKLEVKMPFDSIRNQWWSFGDGTKSQDKNPVHWYHKAGVFSLKLIVEHQNGLFDTIQNQDFIQIGKPKAGFSTLITNECDSSRLKLLNQSKRADSYIWNLGTAGSSKSLNPELKFKDSSNQLIMLNAIDLMGCSHQLNKNLAVGTPNPYFNFPSKICLGDTVEFKSNILNYYRLEWLIGGNVIQGDTITLIPTDTGVFEIRVKAYDQSGCFKLFRAPKKLMVSDPKANFDVLGITESCDSLRPQIINQSSGADSYRWFFGDGDSSLMKNPDHIYTEEGKFQLVLEAMKGGCVDRKKSAVQLVVNHAKADFQVVQTEVCLPIHAKFFDRSRGAVSWNWDFGDGQASIKQHPEHTYQLEPNKQSLSIVDSNGCRGRVSKNAIVLHAAEIIADRWEGCIPLKVHFNDTTANVVQYKWDFGDGSTSNLKNPTHTYMKPGSYDLSLITQSVEGCSDTLFLPKAIVAGKVEADFISNSSRRACAPHLTVFENRTKGATNFYWDFGDGTAAELEEPSKVYHKAGVFDVRLIADNGHSCRDTAIQKGRFIVNTPEVDFSISDTAHCGPGNIIFNDLSKRIRNRKWFLGDGSTDTSQKVNHFYGRVGQYEVTLMATDTAGCQEHISKSLSIKQSPIARFSVDTTVACSPAVIAFSNQSTQLDQATQFWKLNQNHFKAEAKDTVFQFQKAERIDAALIVENHNGCRDTAELEEEIKIFETKEVDQSRILSLSRTLQGGWELEWEKNHAAEFKGYQLYRKTDSNRYEPFYFTEDADFTKLSIEPNAVWNSRQCFKLEVIYYCAERAGIADLETYCSVDLKSQADSQGVFLKWTAYPTATFKEIEVWRKPFTGGKFSQIAILPADELKALDSTFLCPESYVYRLKVSDIYGLGLSAWSDTTTAFAKRNIQSMKLPIKRATVINNQDVLLEWKETSHSPQVVSGYRLERSMSRGGFRPAAELPLSQSSYLDQLANPENRAVSYKLSLIHQCQAGLKVEQKAASIWLNIDAEGSINHLQWTPAVGLSGGVKKYHIQRKNPSGEWETIKTVDPDQLDAIIDLYDLE